MPSSTGVAPAPATTFVVVVAAVCPVFPFSTDVDIPDFFCAVVVVVVAVAYTVAPPGVQVSMSVAAAPAPHAGGTGHSVVVSAAFHEMCQGAWTAVHDDTVVPAMVVAASMTCTQGWVAQSMGQSVAESSV